MKSTPIIYSAPMVQARLAGRKTNTRRLIKPQPDSIKPLGKNGSDIPYRIGKEIRDMPGVRLQEIIKCPYGGPGDELWTRENYHIISSAFSGSSSCINLTGRYCADGMTFNRTLTPAESAKFFKWKRQIGNFPAIYMFRSLCRDVATITSVRPQRLQQISDEDAIAEGIEPYIENGVHLVNYWKMGTEGAACSDPTWAYQRLWDSINAKRAPWSANPWVWDIKTTAHA